MTYTPGLNGGRINATIGGNTAGGGALVSTGTMTLAGGNNITLSQAGNAISIVGGGGGGVTNHSDLAGLTTGDDHPQYWNAARLERDLDYNYDSFNRANTTGPLGTMDQGGRSWSVALGTDFGITSNQAYNPDGGYNINTFDAGSTAGIINMKVNDVSGEFWAIFRLVDSSNYFRLGKGAGGGTYVCERIINGSADSSFDAQTGTFPTAVNGDELRIRLDATDGINLFVNGTWVWGGGDKLFIHNGYYVGMAMYGTVARVDSFSWTPGGMVVAPNLQNVTLAGNSTSAGAGYANISSGTMTLAGGDNITLSQNANAVTISGPTPMSLAVSGLITNGALSTVANGLANLYFYNMILSQTQNSISVSGPSLYALSAGMSGGNTAGWGNLLANKELKLAGGNNVTLSNSISIDAGFGLTETLSVVGPDMFNAGISNLGNTAGNSGTRSNQLILAGGNNVTLSQATGAGGATITIDAATGGGGGGGDISYSYFNPQDAYVQVAGVQGDRTLHMQPMQSPNVVFDQVAIPLYLRMTATSATASFSLSYSQGLYTRNDSTLSLLSSWSTSYDITIGTSNSSLYGNIKLLTIATTGTLTAGQYFFANIYDSASGGANAVSFSQILASQQNSNFYGHFGSAHHSTMQYTRGLGVLSVSTTAMPNSIAFSQLRGTASIYLRQPIFYFVSGSV